MHPLKSNWFDVKRIFQSKAKKYLTKVKDLSNMSTFDKSTSKTLASIVTSKMTQAIELNTGEINIHHL